MKIPEKLCIVLLMIRLLVIHTSAEPLPDSLTDALPPAAEELLDEIHAEDYNALTLSDGLQQLAGRVGELFLSLFRDQLGGAVLLLIVVILCGVTGDLHTAGAPDGSPRFIPMAGALVIATIAVGRVRSLMELGVDTMEQLDIFAKSLLPTLSAAVAAGGGYVTAGVQQVSTVLFTNLLLSLIRKLLLPMVYVYVAVAAADAMLPEHDLKRLRGGIGKGITWSLTALLAVFTAYLTVSGAAGTSADSVTLRLTRSAISTAVPVVGSVISDAAESVLASAGVLRTSIGVFGMLGVLATCLTPFVHLAVQYLTYKLTAFLASVVGSESLVELIDALGSAFGLVLGMTGACALLLLIAVASAVKVVVT
ncbi:MAG: stage III sporulation protein AE [Oscillospiraceae bacterium]|nr:stage III sporulation protein AE [Oscillospiraceae bacterium]